MRYRKKYKGQAVLKVIGVLMIWAALYWLFDTQPTLQEAWLDAKQDMGHWLLKTADTEQSPSSNIQSMAKPSSGCEKNIPSNATVFQMSETAQGALMLGNVYLLNDLPHPALIHFINNDSQLSDYAVFMHPKTPQNVQVPAGTYELMVESGATWCNAEDGFKDGGILSNGQLIFIDKSHAKNVRIAKIGEGPDDMMLTLSDGGGSNMSAGQLIEGRGSIHLSAQMNGHYFIDGTINGQPAHFLVDTGASYISISEEFAKKAGIVECIAGQSNTANGIVNTCAAHANEIQIGGFTARNMVISYHKGLGEQFLLGMEFLRHFKIENRDNTMILTR